MKRAVVCGAVLALGVSGVSAAQARPAELRVNGGGQIIADRESSGPGQTVAFTAVSDGGSGDSARGQLEFNDHQGTRVHGTVQCLRVEGNRAVLAGVYQDGEDTPFQLIVVDQGTQGTDMLLFTEEDDCENDESAAEKLGRGNVTVHQPR